MSLQLDPNRYDACPQYNDWLDAQYLDQYGQLNILSFQPRPSEVLFMMSPDTYEATFSDFVQQRAEEIKEGVWDGFPSPIAYYFYRFENGYESELQRLHFLRDTWESIVDIVHALAVAEFRHHKIAPTTPLSFSNLFTDRIDQRLKNVRLIIDQLAAAGIASTISQIAPIPTLDTMKELNQSRNAFSHSAAQSETQARNWINECLEDVLDVLADLYNLKNIQIARYLNQTGLSLRCEFFKGHSSTRTIRNIVITNQQMAASAQYFQTGQIIVIANNIIFSLRPLIHYREDAVGHTTRLCIFRKTHGDAPSRRIEYEVVGEAVRHEEDRMLFSAELTELRALFGLGPD